MIARSGVRGWLWVLAAAVSAAASARSPEVWAPSTREAFETGTMHGTALDRRGHVRLGPELETLWGPETGIVWAVAGDPRGGAFAALSGPGRVLRLASGQEPQVWYEAGDDVLVTAMAAAGRRGIWFGISGGDAHAGDVLRARRAGEHEVAFRTDAAHVWSLLPAPDGALWIGTGAPGKLLRYQDGTVETVFESGDDPVRSLAFDGDGRLLVGTGSRGLVIRFDADRRPFVLHDADEDEVVAIVAGPGGAVFAATAGAERKGRGKAAARPKSTAREAGPATKAPAGENANPHAPPDAAGRASATPTGPPSRPRHGGALYRLGADGGVRRLWRSSTETPYAAVARGDAVAVATGPAGRILELDRDGETTRLMRFPSDQATALAPEADGSILIGGSKDARVARIGPRPAPEGSYLAEPLDAGGIADWGRIRWEAEVPDGAELTLEVRAGNTSRPDRTWSAWGRPEATAGSVGARAPAPAARWFQVRISLAAAADGASPVLRRIELFYAVRNRPPRIESLEVGAPGEAWAKRRASSQAGRGPIVADDPVSRRASRALAAPSRSPRIQKSYEPGVRTFHWKAEDPDGDALRYELDVARVDDERWLRLGTGLGVEFFSWDSRAMPDGLYRARLTVDDSQNHAAGRELSASRLSEPFYVDHTRPVISAPSIVWRKTVRVAEFAARDPGGRVEAVEVASPDGSWRRLDPLDGVADAEEERFRVEITEVEATSLLVRAIDAAGNVGGALLPLDD